MALNSPAWRVGMRASDALCTSRSRLSLYSMMSAMVTISRPCSLAMTSRSGMRAILPSSFIISQMTPLASHPARRARSTEPSVCPVLTRTPPSRARRGNMWPGRARSSGLASGAMASSMVLALSAADMPVVIPFLASMDTVNAVL